MVPKMATKIHVKQPIDISESSLKKKLPATTKSKAAKNQQWDVLSSIYLASIVQHKIISAYLVNFSAAKLLVASRLHKSEVESRGGNCN